MTARFTLPQSLRNPSDDEALKLLRCYYGQGDSRRKNWYSGGSWDDFDPSGTRAASANVFTSDDVVSLRLLSVDLKPKAVVRLLIDDRQALTYLLEDVGADRDFAGLTAVDEPGFPEGYALWRRLQQLPDVGPTKASKLMARKRPRLFPIWDSVVQKHVFGGDGQQWAPLHRALNAENRALVLRLERLREAAGLTRVSPLRIFDVIAWMEGKGNCKTVEPPQS